MAERGYDNDTQPDALDCSAYGRWGLVPVSVTSRRPMLVTVS